MVYQTDPAIFAKRTLLALMGFQSLRWETYVGSMGFSNGVSNKSLVREIQLVPRSSQVQSLPLRCFKFLFQCFRSAPKFLSNGSHFCCLSCSKFAQSIWFCSMFSHKVEPPPVMTWWKKNQSKYSNIAPHPEL